MGLPIPFGKSSQQSTAIESTSQLSIPSARNLLDMCPTKSLMGKLEHDAIEFGYDSAAGCILSLNRIELMNLCCQGMSSCSGSSPYTDPNTGVPYFFANSLLGGYVGIYGSADPLDISQWYPFTASIPSSSNRAWDDQLGVCSNMFTGESIA